MKFLSKDNYFIFFYILLKIKIYSTLVDNLQLLDIKNEN